MCEHREEPEAKRTKMQRFISVTDRVLEMKVRHRERLLCVCIVIAHCMTPTKAYPVHEMVKQLTRQ